MDSVQIRGAGMDPVAGTFQDHAPMMVAFAPNWRARAVMFRLLGAAMLVAASSLWVLPAPELDGELRLIRLGVSVFFLFCGLALFLRRTREIQPDAYFDPIRREVRVLRKNDRGRPQTILRRSYDSLGSAKFVNSSVQLVDVDGSVLMRLVIEDAGAREALRAQLAGMVRIT